MSISEERRRADEDRRRRRRHREFIEWLIFVAIIIGFVVAVTVLARQE